MAKTIQGKIIKGIKSHPFVIAGLLIGGGFLIWYLFFRGQNTTVSPQTTQTPTNTTNPSLSSPVSVSPSISNPFTSNPASTQNPATSTYSAPALSSGGISSGFNTGYINNQPYNYFYNNAPVTNTTNTSNVSNVSNVSNNVQKTTSTVNNNQKTVSTNYNIQNTKNLSTTGAFSAINSGSSVASGLLGALFGNPTASSSAPATTTAKTTNTNVASGLGGVLKNSVGSALVLTNPLLAIGYALNGFKL